MSRFGRHVLELDCEAEAARIGAWLRSCTAQVLHRRGLVVAISGGIDSSVCATLAVRALGTPRVCLLILPEHDSDPDSAARAELLAAHLGVKALTFDIAPTLMSIGCYAERDAAVRSVLPGYGDGWRMKLAITGGTEGAINRFRLVAQSPDGTMHERDLPLPAYLAIVAATSFKQRIRKTVEYFHADRLNYAVVGTPNRLEYDQGFFVKNGDGAADVKPIAHLYKTQVYQLAEHLGIVVLPQRNGEDLDPELPGDAARVGRGLHHADLGGPDAQFTEQDGEHRLADAAEPHQDEPACESDVGVCGTHGAPSGSVGRPRTPSLRARGRGLTNINAGSSQLLDLT